ncbi:hypothetical protein [Streptomyces sp. SID13726]|uniref:hypothetical protein n=1 Tax=Streptomyces sp. SID13726 TaxID=2706058 RepID=UPI0013B88701|nr:hypothetical protein [Streptomyces sp. SID13726]NEB00604.1 hypothetical protein [Streptomyces sp. SID13726]
MTQPTPPRQVIADALWDWWTTTDPAAPFDPAQAATDIDTTLTTHGYTIHTHTTRTPPVPTLRAIATHALITLLATAAAIAAALRDEWGWAAVGTLSALALGYECLRDLRDRHHGRTAR